MTTKPTQTKQLLYDGQKALTLDQLMGDALWTSIGGNVPISTDVRRYYQRVGLLYRCVHLRADGLSKVPWVITDDRDETVWFKDDVPPANLLFMRRLARLLHKTELALSLGSQAYWHKERNRVAVTGLRWFAPLSTEPYWDAYRGLTHFVRNTGVEMRDIPVDDVVYIRFEDALHETLRDISPAEAAMQAAGVLYNVDAFTAAFFERGAIKATLLTVQGNPPKPEMERLKAWWSRVFSGVQNAFKTEVVSADAIAPVVVGEGIQELSNTELTGEKREDLATTMGVPLSMLFADAANYATAEQDEKNFYNSTIIPDCDLIAEQVNEQLLAPLGLHLVFKPETMDVFQADENARAQSFGTYVSAGLPKSLAAEMLGLELPDGWEYADLDEEPEPMDAEPTAPDASEQASPDDTQSDGALAQAVPARQDEMRRFRAWAKKRAGHIDPAKFKSDLLSAADKAALLEEMEGGTASESASDFFTSRVILPPGAITPEAFKALLLQLDPDDDEAERAIREALERRFERGLTDALREQLADLLPDGATDDQIRMVASQVEATSGPVREVLRRWLEQSGSLGVTVALDTLERVGLGFDWTLANTDAARWASQYSYELVRGINNTTAQRLQVAVNDWFQERTTLPDLVRELAPTFGRQRAKIIAATETTRAAAEGSRVGFAQSGVVREVEIRTARDELVCPICGPKYGTRTPLQGGDMPPFHVGCRCWVAPVIEES